MMNTPSPRPTGSPSRNPDSSSIPVTVSPKLDHFPDRWPSKPPQDILPPIVRPLGTPIPFCKKVLFYKNFCCTNGCEAFSSITV